jgi:general secretion pathway protein L
MPSTLLIRQTRARGLEWTWFDERGRGSGVVTRGEAPTAGELARAGRVVVLVPGEDCAILDATVAARSREQWLKALPFAVEDQLADPVEQLHFGVGPRQQAPIVAVRRELLARWLADLERRGIVADALLPDVLGLAAANDGAALLLERDRAVVRIGQTRGFAIERENLDAMLGDAKAAPRRIERSADAAAGRYSEAVVIEPLLALTSAADPAQPNLLVGEFAPAHRAAPARRLWRAAGWLAAAALLLGLTWIGLDFIALQRRADALRSEMVAAYRAVYPDGRVDGVDLAGRMRADLGAVRGGGGGALIQLGRVAPLLAADPRVLLTAIEYRAGVLELEVLGPDVGALDAVRERVATLAGISVELTAASTSVRGAEGRLRIAKGVR